MTDTPSKPIVVVTVANPDPGWFAGHPAREYHIRPITGDEIAICRMAHVHNHWWLVVSSKMGSGPPIGVPVCLPLDLPLNKHCDEFLSCLFAEATTAHLARKMLDPAAVADRYKALSGGVQ